MSLSVVIIKYHWCEDQTTKRGPSQNQTFLMKKIYRWREHDFTRWEPVSINHDNLCVLIPMCSRSRAAHEAHNERIILFHNSLRATKTPNKSLYVWSVAPSQMFHSASMKTSEDYVKKLTVFFLVCNLLWQVGSTVCSSFQIRKSLSHSLVQPRRGGADFIRNSLHENKCCPVCSPVNGLAQLHFGQWSSLPFCLPSLIVKWRGPPELFLTATAHDCETGLLMWVCETF